MNGALQGIRVLDLSRVLAGPYCTMILGDLGADVIKIERPGVGDDLRGWGPPFGPSGDSTYFLGVNRNKRGLTVDLRSDAGREAILRLAAISDVVVENFRVGMLEGMGLGYDVLKAQNPGLVYCGISGYGHTGPWAKRPGYDVIMQAMGGLMSVTGEPDGRPMRVGVAIVDLCTGLYAAVGILAALQARQRTGLGQRVDLSLLETVLATLPNLTAGYLLAGAEPQRLGTGHPNVTPYGVFPTRDAYIVLAIGNDTHWRRLCDAIAPDDLADDLRNATGGERMERREEVEALIEEWFGQLSADELTERLTAHDVPVGPVKTIPEVLAHEQAMALEIVRSFPMGQPDTGSDSEGPMVRLPLTFSQDQRTSHLPPPPLPARNVEVLRDLGFGSEEVATLERGGAFGPPASDR
jgi:crotonobetainyl-CoA:carnitine CoA-transferase CaiB-like acyl-CoA transferase